MNIIEYALIRKFYISISVITIFTLVFLGNTNQSFQLTIPSSPVAYWPFNNLGKDESGNNNNGSVVGAISTQGVYGNAISLDGNDYVSVPNSSSLDLKGAFTLSSWIKLDTLSTKGNYPRIIEKSSDEFNRYQMLYNKAAKTFGFGFLKDQVGKEIFTKKTNWDTGNWYHIVGTYDPNAGSNNMKIYVNGLLDNSATVSGNPPSTTGKLMIGAKASLKEDFWQGDIDQVRIYAKALSAQQVKDLYDERVVKFTIWKDSSGYVYGYNHVSNETEFKDTDASVVIQNAVDAVSAMHGGTVFIKASTYLLKKPILLKSSLTMTGEQAETTILMRTTDSPSEQVFDGDGVSDVSITDITVDGNAEPKARLGSSVISFEDCSNITLSELYAQDSDASGIVMRRCDTATISDNTISNVWTGINLQSSSNIQVLRNTIDYALGDGVYISNDFYGISNEGSSVVTVRNNILSRIADTAIDSSMADTTYRNNNIIIESNTISDSLTSSLAIDNHRLAIAVSRTIDPIVSSNIINGYSMGIMVGNTVITSDSSKPVNIFNNTIKNFDKYGIGMYYPDLIVSGNYIDAGSYSSSTGITIGSTKGVGTIKSNKIINTKYGIAWEGSSPDMVIQYNTIINPRLYGISDKNDISTALWTSRSVVSDNTISDNRIVPLMKYGIYQSNSGVSWTIKSDKITGFTISPMLLSSSSNIL